MKFETEYVHCVEEEFCMVFPMIARVYEDGSFEWMKCFGLPGAAGFPDSKWFKLSGSKKSSPLLRQYAGLVVRWMKANKRSKPYWRHILEKMDLVFKQA